MGGVERRGAALQGKGVATPPLRVKRTGGLTFNYTRRFFGGRHPLWGTGVTSRIKVMFTPVA